MHRITLTVILLFSVTAADAAWYQQTDGTIVDPIQSVFGGDHEYSGINLQPGADLTGAGLYSSLLSSADLSGATLSESVLTIADMPNADLSGVYMQYGYMIDTDLRNADLSNAIFGGVEMDYSDLTDAILTGAVLDNVSLYEVNLSGADLSGSDFSTAYYYETATWIDAFYYADNEPTWESGMNAVWRSNAGILALAPTSSVPEPSSIALLGVAAMGLCLLARGRRNR